MAKGAIPSSHPLSLGTVGLKAHDLVAFGIDEADLVICVGYDMVEYDPAYWNPNHDKSIIHVDATAAEVDTNYIVEAGVIGDLKDSMRRISARCERQVGPAMKKLRGKIVDMLNQHADDTDFPIKPQKIICDLRKAMDPEDIVISDVGAHKMWMARMFQAERPQTLLLLLSAFQTRAKVLQNFPVKS